METLNHTTLKRLALAWLRGQGYLAAACEVRSPIAQWVIDVAGWRDSWFDQRIGRCIRLDHPQTIIIECKQSRADFLRDSRRFDALLALREKYEGMRRSIEEHRIKALEPQLRLSGTNLFAELEEWDFASSTLPAYRRTMEKLERLDERLHGQTKFCRIARYALADGLYVATPKGLVHSREMPHGWGLLECDGACLSKANARHAADARDEMHASAAWKTRIEAPALASPPHHRHRMLRNIAIAASAMANRQPVETADPFLFSATS